jgi:hypothetical protein
VVFRPRRASSPAAAPFPHNDCLAATIHAPTPKQTDGAGTQHLISRDEKLDDFMNDYKH